MGNISDFLTNLNSTDIAIYSLWFFMLVIILLSVYLVRLYLEPEIRENEKKKFDLALATKALKEMDIKPKNIEMEEYERDQENQAIISYEELLESTKKMPLIIESEIEKQEAYDEEEAPISINEYVNKDVNEDLNLTKEMEFLKDLKSFRANMK